MASIGFTLSGLDEVGPGDFTNKAIKPNFLHNVGKTHRYLDEVLPISVVGHGGAGGAELGPYVLAAEGLVRRSWTPHQVDHLQHVLLQQDLEVVSPKGWNLNQSMDSSCLLDSHHIVLAHHGPEPVHSPEAQDGDHVEGLGHPGEGDGEHAGGQANSQ